MLGQQDLVECRGHLRKKNGIMVVLIALRSLRIPGVHRMTGLVRKRIHVGKYIGLIIHHDVWRAAVGAVAECAAALALVFIAVAPSSSAQAIAEGGQVLVSERSDRAEHVFHRLVPFYRGLNVTDHGNVSVVLM